MSRLSSSPQLLFALVLWCVCASALAGPAPDAPRKLQLNDQPTQSRGAPAEADAPLTEGSISRSTAAPAAAPAAPPALPAGSAVPAVMDRGMLVDLHGRTLYVFDGDRRANVSTCHGLCETLWPPLLAPTDAEAVGDFTPFHRRDGSLQWSHRGRPLYRWARDAKPGDVTGDGVNKVWHLIRQSAPAAIKGKTE